MQFDAHDVDALGLVANGQQRLLQRLCAEAFLNYKGLQVFVCLCQRLGILTAALITIRGAK